MGLVVFYVRFRNKVKQHYGLSNQCWKVRVTGLAMIKLDDMNKGMNGRNTMMVFISN